MRGGWGLKEIEGREAERENAVRKRGREGERGEQGEGELKERGRGERKRRKGGWWSVKIKRRVHQQERERGSAE